MELNYSGLAVKRALDVVAHLFREKLKGYPIAFDTEILVVGTNCVQISLILKKQGYERRVLWTQRCVLREHDVVLPCVEPQKCDLLEAGTPDCVSSVSQIAKLL